jgi:hypothetical protein
VTGSAKAIGMFGLIGAVSDAFVEQSENLVEGADAVRSANRARTNLIGSRPGHARKPG